jgi:hypothetical protein
VIRADVQDWRQYSMFKEPLIYIAVVLAIALIIFVALASWWPI